MAAPKSDETGLTPKQEAFCRAFLETGNATEAYRRSYDVEPNARDSWIHVEASQLLDNPKVAERLGVLRDELDRLSIYTVRRAMDEYEEARLAALALGQAGPAVAAVTGKVKLFGLDRPQRVEVTGRDGKPIQTETVDRTAEVIKGKLDGIAGRTTGGPSEG